LGAILAQADEDGNEYVCHYASRCLKGTELNYGISEKECIAIVWAIGKFRPQFKVVTDHSAVKWPMEIKDPTGRVARWSIYLQSYDFEMTHRKGRAHLNVDPLSRPQEEHVLAIHAEGENDPYDDKN